MITSLRRQVNDQKIQINVKDEEIEKLRSSSKCAKYAELELKLQSALEEYTMLTEKFNYLKNMYTEYLLIFNT
jgi:hypothetical protein